MTTIYKTKRTHVSSPTNGTNSTEPRTRSINIKHTDLINDVVQPSLSRQSSINKTNTNHTDQFSTDDENIDWTNIRVRGRRAHSSMSPYLTVHTIPRQYSDNNKPYTNDLIIQLKQQINASEQSRRSRQHSVITSLLESYCNNISFTAALPTRSIQQNSNHHDAVRYKVETKPPLSRTRSTGDNKHDNKDDNHSTNNNADNQLTSNLQRFLAEEAARKQYAAQQLQQQKTRHDVYTKQWKPPTSTTDAQLQWKHMQQEINTTWNQKYQSNTATQTSIYDQTPTESIQNSTDTEHTPTHTRQPQETVDTPRSKCKSMSIAQLKSELQQRNISIDGCVEKSDLIKRLIAGIATPIITRTTSRSVDSIDQSKIVQQQQQQVVDVVAKWAQKYSDIRSMLNYLNNAHFSHADYLNRHHTYDDINKQYKRVLLQYHPDKQINASAAEQLRATEIIKYLNQAMSKYKAEQRR